jgi:hypothetical protein
MVLIQTGLAHRAEASFTRYKQMKQKKDVLQTEELKSFYLLI